MARGKSLLLGALAGAVIVVAALAWSLWSPWVLSEIARHYRERPELIFSVLSGVVSLLVIIVGFRYTLRRIRASEEAAEAPSRDALFLESLKMFTDRSADVSVRKAALLGLEHVSQKRSRVDNSEYPLRQAVVSLLVESLHGEGGEDLVDAICERLVAIGGAALQTLVDAHRLRYSSGWHVDNHSVRDEDRPYAYRASRDTILRIARHVAPYSLASDYSHYSRPDLTGVRALGGRLALRLRWLRRVAGRELWLDTQGLAYLCLAGYSLRPSDLPWRLNLQGANLINTILDHQDLAAADLRYACLSMCFLTVVDFGGADLSGAVFAHAHLDNTMLRKAKNWREARWAHSTWWQARITIEQARWLLSEVGLPDHPRIDLTTDAAQEWAGALIEEIKKQPGRWANGRLGSAPPE